MNHEQAHWMLEAMRQQAASLERIAVAVEAMTAVLEPAAIPAQPMRRDELIGPGREEFPKRTR